MALSRIVMSHPRVYRIAQRAVRWQLRLLTRVPRLARALPGLSDWTAVRELPEPETETFRDWWRGRAEQ
jgi:L-lactate dehydrogenase complex protein LldF